MASLCHRPLYPLILLCLLQVYSNELYIFYNHSNAEYWTQNEDTLLRYNELLRKSFYVTLANLTGHSMNISQQTAFENQPWSHGGIEHWTPCLLFNTLLSTAPDLCPSVPVNAPSNAQYVAVVKFNLVTDGDSIAFDDYIFEQLSSSNYYPLFYHWLILFDETNTKRPSLSPTHSLSPTLAPTASFENSDIAVSTPQNTEMTETRATTVSDVNVLPGDVATTNKKHSDIVFVAICIVFVVVILAFIAFVVCRKYGRKRAPAFNQVVSTTAMELNEVDMEDGLMEHETTMLTPESVRL
mmetsp:Transcript_18722/g.29707  ORF Transcript_18722/g.29707 Transcript_18722/m.29707 type:complete len:297 (-) Transcript_18722:32-922(-)